MQPLLISILTFMLLLGGTMVGARLRGALPKHHLSEESKDIAKTGIGFLATLCALVLGLLIASAKTSYDNRSEEVIRAATQIVLLDRNLRQYGPEADSTRALLHRIVTTRAGLLWPESIGPTSAPRTDGTPQSASMSIEDLQRQLRELSPAGNSQRLILDRALHLSQDLAETRWLAIEQTIGSIPVPFLVLLIFWLTVIATCIGIYAPRNRTLAAVALACSLSTATAIFLVLEMDRPFEGLLRVSDAPLRDAIAYLER